MGAFIWWFAYTLKKEGILVEERTMGSFTFPDFSQMHLGNGLVY
jgi:hypothetical protein